jgi:ankyrin repeat protein
MNSIDRELIEVSKENNLLEVSRLLSVGADVNAKDFFASTPLHWAGLKGHVAIAKELLYHGADTDAKDTSDETPLIGASCHGHVQVVKELLGCGVSIDATLG